MFLSDDLAIQLATFALVPQIVQKVSSPSSLLAALSIRKVSRLR
jgi:hypothetical protein